jgi:hypothetical protein
MIEQRRMTADADYERQQTGEQSLAETAHYAHGEPHGDETGKEKSACTPLSTPVAAAMPPGAAADRCGRALPHCTLPPLRDLIDTTVPDRRTHFVIKILLTIHIVRLNTPVAVVDNARVDKQHAGVG